MPTRDEVLNEKKPRSDRPGGMTRQEILNEKRPLAAGDGKSPAFQRGVEAFATRDETETIDPFDMFRNLSALVSGASFAPAIAPWIGAPLDPEHRDYLRGWYTEQQRRKPVASLAGALGTSLVAGPAAAATRAGTALAARAPAFLSTTVPGRALAYAGSGAATAGAGSVLYHEGADQLGGDALEGAAFGAGGGLALEGAARVAGPVLSRVRRSVSDPGQDHATADALTRAFGEQAGEALNPAIPPRRGANLLETLPEELVDTLQPVVGTPTATAASSALRAQERSLRRGQSQTRQNIRNRRIRGRRQRDVGGGTVQTAGPQRVRDQAKREFDAFMAGNQSVRVPVSGQFYKVARTLMDDKLSSRAGSQLQDAANIPDPVARVSVNRGRFSEVIDLLRAEDADGLRALGDLENRRIRDILARNRNWDGERAQQANFLLDEDDAREIASILKRPMLRNFNNEDGSAVRRVPTNLANRVENALKKQQGRSVEGRSESLTFREADLVRQELSRLDDPERTGMRGAMRLREIMDGLAPGYARQLERHAVFRTRAEGLEAGASAGLRPNVVADVEATSRLKFENPVLRDEYTRSYFAGMVQKLRRDVAESPGGMLRVSQAMSQDPVLQRAVNNTNSVLAQQNARYTLRMVHNHQRLLRMMRAPETELTRSQQAVDAASMAVSGAAMAAKVGPLYLQGVLQSINRLLGSPERVERAVNMLLDHRDVTRVMRTLRQSEEGRAATIYAAEALGRAAALASGAASSLDDPEIR